MITFNESKLLPLTGHAKFKPFESKIKFCFDDKRASLAGFAKERKAVSGRLREWRRGVEGTGDVRRQANSRCKKQ